MCGLVGAMGMLSVKEESVFKMLLQLDTLRGPHSTGVVSYRPYDKERPLLYLKTLGTPWDMVEKSRTAYNSLFSGSVRMLMGHNRYATTGAITSANAHPFDFNNVIGMHNGTLRDWRDLQDSEKFEVDSAALLNHIDIHGVKDAFEKAGGAWALTFYDKTEGVLNIVRNSERPLSYAYTTDRKVMFWASEGWMIKAACEQFGVKIGDIRDFAENLLYRFEVPDSWKQELEKPLVISVPKGRPRPFNDNFLLGKYRGNIVYQAPAHTRTVVVEKKDRGVTDSSTSSPANTGPLCSKRVGSVVAMRCVANVVEENNASKGSFSHILCESIGPEHFQIRVSSKPGDRIWGDFLANRGRLFTVKIKKLSANKKYYLGDRRTVQLATDTHDQARKKDEAKTLAHLSDGRTVDRNEWARISKDGCSWCTSPLPFAKAEEVTWSDGGEPFCKGCQDVNDVRNYLNGVY